jgi:phage pi2 protein 07
MFLLEVIAALNKERVPYAVAGGYAVALHGAIRGTVDIDFVISLKPKHLEGAESALKSIGLSSRIPVTHVEISQFRKEYIKKKNLIAWGFIDLKDPTRMVDLLLTDDISKHKMITKQVQGVTIKILSIPSLIKMKKVAGRPQDLEDIKALEKLK